MELIVFTKHFKGQSIEETIEAIKKAGATGADLCVRPGYYVTPENISEKLPEVVKVFKEAGLSIPMITTPTLFVSPGDPAMEKVLVACGKSGIRLIKLGYWFMDKEGYWPTVDRVRKELEKLVKLARKHNVKICIHNHSESSMGLNSCSVMNLVKGFDPKCVGVILDPGHLSIVGEPLPMAFSIVKEYISIVAVKDVTREKYKDENGLDKWRIKPVPLREGFVDLHDLAVLLNETKFSGPISMHSEYNLPLEALIAQTKTDIEYFKNLMEKAG
ncbi:MAG: hypothetical protein A2252_06755 [Elusimicrobia bacterium RIFOXYA2_FULL_39_19]|nr:MAG: hypothetical protein A2252_06755 [Elusimicrobia bacterium RIFOXYA2_FULL_39_19]